MADPKLPQKSVRENSFKRIVARLVLLAFLNQNLTFATHSIIELDVQGSQTPQRLHRILPSSKIADVSHIEIDADKQQVAVYRKDEANIHQEDKDLSGVPPERMKEHPVILQKHNIINLPWNLESEKLTLFILNHTAWLNPLGEDGYKLEFRGGLKGGGNTGSTGGGGGSGGECHCSPIVATSLETNQVVGVYAPHHYGECPNTGYDFGTSHHGGNDRSGGYGSSTISSTDDGSRGSHIGALQKQGIFLHHPLSVSDYIKKNAFLPKDYVKDTLLDDALLQVVIDYNKGGSSPMKIVLEPMAYIVRQDLRNMLNGLSKTRDYTCPLSQSDVLKRLQILCDIHIDIASPDTWGVGPGSNCFHWGQIKKLNKNSAISKALVPKLFNKGVTLLKASGQPVYKGSQYLLTQDVKGHLSVVCPYNGLAYPLFAEDRLLPNAYLPKEYVHHPLLDKPLWEQIHTYVQTSLSTLQGARMHLEPLFYITSKPLQEALVQAGKSNVYTSVKTRSAIERQLQNAIEYHVFLTPLFKQDKTFNITKTLTPLLFNKGVDLLQASKAPIPKTLYTLTLNTEGRLASLCPWNGLVYPLFPDDRANYKAFFPPSYGRNSNEIYLNDFLYKLAGDTFSGQEQGYMRYVFAPLPYVSRTAFNGIPAKGIDFPSLKESSTLLLGMTGDVMDGMPLEDFLSKAQKFFDKEIPFKKINDDTLVHQHLSQNMLAKELREERWTLRDQYWKTINPVAQWGVIAKVMEEVARKYKIPGARIHGLIQVIEAVQEGGFEFVSQEKNERKVFLDHHVEEGFGRKVAEWLDYDAELMQVGKKLPFDIDPLAPHDMFNLQDKMGGFGGGKLGLERLRGKNKLNPQKIERDLGTITESGFLKEAERYLGKDYVVHSKGRYVSKDGSRQIRYGRHETEDLKDHHAHFEAYDLKTGKLNEWGRVKIIND